MCKRIFSTRPRPVLAGLVALLSLATGCTAAHVGVTASRSTAAASTGSATPSAPPTGSAVASTAARDIRVATIYVSSAAVGGREQGFYVFLPPGYAREVTRRYPVLYLFHGVGGIPHSYLSVTDGASEEADLIRRGLMKPLILVIPVPPWKTDSEWANSSRPADAWETFVARDVVAAVDAHFRTIRTAGGRGIGGLSQGGYEAINIALHNPGVFRFVESWSGYSVADQATSVFNGDQKLIAYNSPLSYIDTAWRTVRGAGMYFWLYIGAVDGLRQQNRDFVAKLQKYGIGHTYFEVSGQGHGWILWSRFTGAALIAASTHLAHT